MTRLWPDGIPVLVRGEGATPVCFLWQGVTHEVIEVCNRWRIHTRWWAPSRRDAATGCKDGTVDREYATVDREYVKLLTGDGMLCLLYRDHIHGGWFLARIYD